MDDRFVVPLKKPAFENSSVVSARLPNSIIKKLEGIADSTGRSRNEIIILALDYALGRIEIPDK